ncbi:aspartate aminotransferase [Limnochorda pilosa]|uniref:Aminotransferase n=2 Tax=Limnochorda pilosa TaxID=1555112 RepID=A0A0K2SPD2_LIMPI|nr:aspartate aminotransferase [Limnochorda pilosa]
MAVVGTETAFEVLARVAEEERRGRRIVSFCIGEPDFPTPEAVKEAGIEAIRRNETHYSPSAGIRPLREAVAAEIARTRGVPTDPEEVVIAPGAKPILFHSLMAIAGPGDEVVYPNPGFPIYESVIRLAGATPVPLPLREEAAFSFTAEDLATRVGPRTAMVIVNSPHNPTGSVASPEALAELVRLARRHDFWILSDEIYSRILYEGEHRSPHALPGAKERTIVVDGFSKTYAMTGWRIGYGVMPRTLAGDVARLVTNAESCTATFTQHAALAALTGDQEPARRMVEAFRARRDRIVEGLNAIPGIRCLRPQGAFYVFPNVTGLVQARGLASARELQEALLTEAGVAVLSRSAFGTPAGDEDQQYVRLSYATSLEQIDEGLRRLEAYARGGAGRPGGRAWPE